MSGSGISWAICKSAPCSRQITTPLPHHSVFYRPDALPAAQPTASKHWRTLVPRHRPKMDFTFSAENETESSQFKQQQVMKFWVRSHSVLGRPTFSLACPVLGLGITWHYCSASTYPSLKSPSRTLTPVLDLNPNLTLLNSYSNPDNQSTNQSFICKSK